ncbi:hypothetical protein [Peterkaempfera sp. SMS 1(5)a]|uniref:hypothetical protein n=1 Tax=Peterkaempfera podocarpi TaxID=3232308 RepID=UPI00366CDE2C
MANAKKISTGLLTVTLGLVTGTVALVGKAFGAPSGHTMDGLKLAKDTIKEGLKEIREG